MFKSAIKGSLRLYKNSSRGFCIYARYLNPANHITMNHNIQNMYEDVVMIGDYPVPARYAKKEHSKKYIPQMVELVYGYLNQKYVNFSFCVHY